MELTINGLFWVLWFPPVCVWGGAFMFTKVHLMPTLQWCVCLHTCEHITYYIKQFEPNWCWGNVIHKGVILLLSKLFLRNGRSTLEKMYKGKPCPFFCEWIIRNLKQHYNISNCPLCLPTRILHTGTWGWFHSMRNSRMLVWNLMEASTTILLPWPSWRLISAPRDVRHFKAFSAPELAARRSGVDFSLANKKKLKKDIKSIFHSFLLSYL